jgi:ribosomal protein S18 acetylase RimI-like enzyme
MRIRPAVAADKAFILGLADRLVAFGPVPGRDRSQMIDRDRAVLAAALERPAVHTALFVAEDDGGRPAGFIHLTTTHDYYTDSHAAHIADVVVSADAGGRGIGSALMKHAEDWARQRGFEMLTLNVFSANRGARDLYARLGFDEEWIRCIKRLQR